MRKSILISIVAFAVLALPASIAFVVGRTTAEAPSPQAAAPAPPRQETAPPPPTVEQDCTPQWTVVPGAGPAPKSSCWGPHETAHNLASGYSKDTMGAVYAGVNIGTRLASAAGPAVYEPTLRQQTVGDQHEALSEIQRETSPTPAGKPVLQEWLWKPVAGSAESGLITISLAARTPQAERMGGYAALTVTMQWTDGDWKLRLPNPYPELIPSVAGYTSLGSPNA